MGMKKFLKNEIKALCSDSYLLSKDKTALTNFSWSEFYDVIKKKSANPSSFPGGVPLFFIS